MAKSNNDVRISQPDPEGIDLIRQGNDLMLACKAVIASGPANQEQHAARKFFQAEAQRCYIRAYRLMQPNPLPQPGGNTAGSAA